MDYAALQDTVKDLLAQFGVSVTVTRGETILFKGLAVFTDKEKVQLGGSSTLSISTSAATASWLLLPVTKQQVLVGDTVSLKGERDWKVQEVQSIAPAKTVVLQKVRLA